MFSCGATIFYRAACAPESTCGALSGSTGSTGSTMHSLLRARVEVNCQSRTCGLTYTLQAMQINVPPKMWLYIIHGKISVFELMMGAFHLLMMKICKKRRLIKTIPIFIRNFVA
jgi:hypothetical protein